MVNGRHFRHHQWGDKKYFRNHCWGRRTHKKRVAKNLTRTKAILKKALDLKNPCQNRRSNWHIPQPGRETHIWFNKKGKGRDADDLEKESRGRTVDWWMYWGRKQLYISFIKNKKTWICCRVHQILTLVSKNTSHKRNVRWISDKKTHQRYAQTLNFDLSILGLKALASSSGVHSSKLK